MSTGVKAQRPQRLSEDESLTSFEDWKNNLVFYLNQEKTFAALLKSDATWTKTSDDDASRGRVDADGLFILNNFLGVIAGLAPPLLHGDIIDDTTKLDDIFNFIRTYYQFAPSEATFIKFASIKREITNGNIERPVHLYLRMRQFIRDNLLLSSGKITHDGKVPTSNEKMSATTERLVVLRWLELLHPKLPDHVGKIFSSDLRTKSLKDLQPQIMDQIEDLLRDVDKSSDENEASLLYTNFHYRNKPRSRSLENVNYKKSDMGRRNFPKDNKQVHFGPVVSKSAIKKCQACKSLGEPFIGHDVYNCQNILSRDRNNVLKICALDVVDNTEDLDSDEFENQEEIPQDELEDDHDERPLPKEEDISANRVSIKPSPRISVKIINSIVSVLIDTGAEGNMIRYDLCLKIGLKIYQTPHSASQADGISVLEVVGEVHTTLIAENGVQLALDAIVVRKLKAGLIVSEAFLEEHQIVVDVPRRQLVMPDSRTIKFETGRRNDPKVSLLRAEVNSVLFAGESITLSTPPTFQSDSEFVLEPRLESNLLFDPSIVENDRGKLQLSNESNHAVSMKKGQIVGQIRSICEETNTSSIEIREEHSGTPEVRKELKSSDELIREIVIDPQNCILNEEDINKFKQVNKRYSKAFGPKRGTYNGKSGNILASVDMGKATPVPKKGKIPSYKRKDLEVVQERFDELAKEGTLVRPEDHGIKVVHTSPSFLVKKPGDPKPRLVTSFTELNKFIRPHPSRLTTTSDVLRSISRWKYIIKTDLKSAYYQMQMDKESQKWLGTNSPYKGMYVYAKGAMGLRNMAEYLEEIVSRVFGDLIAEGVVDKVADDLQIGGNDVQELLNNWSRVLQRLIENGLTVSPAKTIICPKIVKILGWVWENGTITVDRHRINPLTVCAIPETVKQLRSFIGAFRAVSICIPQYGSYLCRLEDMVAGKDSKDKLAWSDELISVFKEAQSALSNPKTIHLAQPNDQLILISDGCNNLPAVGATLYVKVKESLRVAGYFSAKIHKYQTPWLPCETEALGINLAIQSFAHVIRESTHTTKFLTDSKPCVQAFEKLAKGGFSLSPRVSSFLMNLNAHNISIEHVKGSSIKLTDFASRNPIQCVDSNCQVCKFVKDQTDLAVNAVSIKDIENGSAKMPFRSVSAWKQAQRQDVDLKRCYAQLSDGTRPGRKEKNIRILKRYLQVATISESDLLVHRKPNPYGQDFELVIVPKDLVKGLISALHIQLGHPTKTQFKKVWDRFFYALDADNVIEDCTAACPLCTSLCTLPKELFEQNTSEIPTTVGKIFSADVIRRERQKIFVLQDIFSSFILAQMINDECSTTLQQILLQLAANYKDPDGCSVRVDTAPGFNALKNDKFLHSVGISLDFGRVKNKNKNSNIDKAIQDLEKEIKRLAPNAGPISTGTLAVAVRNSNNRVRMSGLSAKEILTKRDNFTGDPLQFEDRTISSLRFDKRILNHGSSERSKAAGGDPANVPDISTGDIVHVKNDGTKHKARDFYLVMSINYQTKIATIQKFVGSTLRTKQYQVKFTEIYLASVKHASSVVNNDYDYDDNESDDGINLKNPSVGDEQFPPAENEELLPARNELLAPVEPRRSGRNRRKPDFLQTPEIERCSR